MRRMLRWMLAGSTPPLMGYAIGLGALAGAVVTAYDYVLLGISKWLLVDTLRLPFDQAPGLHMAAWLEPPLCWFPLVVAIGLSASWLIMNRAFSGIGSHTTDRVIDAFHNHNGNLPLRVAVAVAIASIFTVALGSAAGREAQAGLIGAAVAVTVGRAIGVRPADLRTIMLIGLAAGFSSAFKTPLGAAFIAIEILYRDLSIESDALIYTIVASVVAYVLTGSLTGWEGEFRVVVPSGFERPVDYFWIALLGAFGGLAAAFMPTVFFAIRKMVAAIPLPGLLKAFGGGLIVGVLGWIAPVIVGDGSFSFSLADAATWSGWTLLAAGTLRLVGLSITLGVGGVGGVLSPSLIIGALLGAGFAHLFELPFLQTAIVGMGTLFAGAARVPIGTLLMVSELTGGYELMPAAALAVAISYAIQIVVGERLPWPSIHGEQPPTLWSSPAHQDEILAAGIGLLQRGGITLPEDLQLPDLKALLSIGYPIHLGHGDLVLCTAEIAGQSEIAGHQLSESPFGPGVWLLEVRHGDIVEQPAPSTTLEAGDRLVLMAPLSRLPDLCKELEFPGVFRNWMARHRPELYERCFGSR